MDVSFYATLEESTLKSYRPDLPFMLPLASWWRRDVQLKRPPRLPSQMTHVAVDCGSYMLAQRQVRTGLEPRSTPQRRSPHRFRFLARDRVAENAADPPVKEPAQLPEPSPSSARAGAPPPTPAATTPSPPALARPASGAQPATIKPSTVPNARKGYKLTLWVSPVTDLGLADVHGLLQLDGADPIPFCQLKRVDNPLARALQEGFLAVERARARPPKMTAPAPAAPAPSPAVLLPSANGPRSTPHKTASPVAPAAQAILPAGSPTPSKLPANQPSLF